MVLFIESKQQDIVETEMQSLSLNSIIKPRSLINVKVKSFAPRQIQRRLFAALVTLSRKVFRPWHKWF